MAGRIGRPNRSEDRGVVLELYRHKWRKSRNDLRIDSVPSSDIRSRRCNHFWGQGPSEDIYVLPKGLITVELE